MTTRTEEINTNATIWLSINFEMIKSRIDRISNQLDNVLLKSESQGVIGVESQIRNQDDSL
ncbi:MAG TPA: hypothetical protein V6D14_22550 [Coleofasciculaceae cyanobacterium]|jgi:hypothetical protein